jgi:hypothetical protein
MRRWFGERRTKAPRDKSPDKKERRRRRKNKKKEPQFYTLYMDKVGEN